MERIDVYDRYGHFTGKVIDKDEELAPGEYYAHCHVVLCHSSGRFLLQRRAMTKKHSPGVWDITGGGVNAGESWKQASMRETKEELGLDIPEEKMRLGWKKTGTDAGNYHLEVWGARFDFDMNDIVPDLSEVDGAKLVPAAEYVEAVCWNKDDAYKAELVRFCAELGGLR